ncbi:hypothetical protein ACP4OV_025304 [Aristida adscensionis]
MDRRRHCIAKLPTTTTTTTTWSLCWIDRSASDPAMMSTSAMSVAAIGGGAAAFGRRTSHRCRVTAAAAAATAAPPCAAKGSDYYAVLSLEHSPAVGAAEVKRAYRRLARRYHPDACPPARRAESTELFLELRRAYETLSDPARRVRYDAELRTAAGGGGGRKTAAAGGAGLGRDVWEAQLCVLRARSERRQRAAKST